MAVLKSKQTRVVGIHGTMFIPTLALSHCKCYTPRFGLYASYTTSGLRASVVSGAHEPPKGSGAYGLLVV